MRPLVAQFTNEIELYLDWGALNGRSASWRNKLVGWANPGSAELVKLAARYPGLTLATFSSLDFFTESVVLEPRAGSLAARIRSLVDNIEPPRLEERGAPRKVSIARFILDTTAPHSCKTSPLVFDALSGADGAEPYFTSTLRNELAYATLLCRRLLADETYQRNAPRVAHFYKESAHLAAYINTQNGGRRVEGQKEIMQSIATITYPQAVFMGLPYWLDQALRARTTYHDRLAHASDAIGARAMHSARHQYTQAALDYLIPAMIMLDGMRPHNYSHARVNKHFCFRMLNDASGRPCGIDRLVFKFKSSDPEGERQKKPQGRGNPPRPREHAIPSTLIDHTVLFEYLVHLRPHMMVQFGRLQTVEEYSLADDRRPLFMSPRASHRTMRLTTATLSTRFGQSLYRMATKVLHRDLPDWGSPEFKANWGVLFRGPLARTMCISYFGGIRGEWADTATYTDDTIQTIQEHYNGVSSALLARQHADNWDNPRHFDDLHDYAVGTATGRRHRPVQIDLRNIDRDNPQRTIDDALDRERRAMLRPTCSGRGRRPLPKGSRLLPRIARKQAPA